MPRGPKRLTHAVSTQAAWRDWHAIEVWARENGHFELAARHTPPEGAGWKTVDRSITALRTDLGAPPGPWGSNVLDGLAPAQREPQLPAAVRPIVEEALASGDLVTANERLHQLSGGKTVEQVGQEWAGKMQPPDQCEQQQPSAQMRPEPRLSRPDKGQTYTHRVWPAYRALCGEMQTPDVPIHALHRRVGGNIHELHDFLRNQCRAQRCVPTTGEPAFAGDAARQSALRLPGEKETFLNIKLLNPPTRQQTPQQPPTITITLSVNQADLVAEALHYGAYELEQYADGHGRDIDGVETHCDYLGDLEKGLMAFVKNPKERAGELRMDQPAALPEQVKVAQYERALRQAAWLKYPPDDRTKEMQQRIDATIDRKVGEFRQECEMREKVKAYEASLWQQVERRHPDLSPEQREHYHERIRTLVADHKAALARHQQPQPPDRGQEQGRGLDR
jgi:hypothetical protein